MDYTVCAEIFVSLFTINNNQACRAMLSI